MADLWLISAPGDKTCQQTWETLNNVTAKQNQLSTNYKFHIPDLKVGTLDVLVGLSDELGKLDSFCEQVARKVAAYLGEVLEDQRDKLHENLMANGVDLMTYMTRFQWDMAKYPIKQSLKNIADIIAKQSTQIDNDLKSKASAYNNLKGNLQAMERKSTGSLLTRNLTDLVKKEDFVLDSEYLTTIIVVVPKSNVKLWYEKYEKLSDMVVPRSTKLLQEDAEHAMFTVTLFNKVIDEYKHHCRENKFMVRDFVYNEEELKQGKEEITKLSSDKKKQFGPLVRWLKVNFSEAFTAWIHVKALRVFVESVLRYGLPVNFQAVLMKPQKKTVKRLREVLNQLYSHLDSSGTGQGGSAELLDACRAVESTSRMNAADAAMNLYIKAHRHDTLEIDGMKQDDFNLCQKFETLPVHRSSQNYSSVMDIPGVTMAHAEYHPYVFYKLSIEMIDQAPTR